MTTTLRPIGPRRDSAREGRVVRAAARELGLTPSTTGQLVRQMGIHRRVAILIRHAVAQGDVALAERLFAPIEAARVGLKPEPLSPELFDSEQRADGLEDVAQLAFLLSPSPERRRAYIAAVRLHRARLLEVLVSLEHEEAK